MTAVPTPLNEPQGRQRRPWREDLKGLKDAAKKTRTYVVSGICVGVMLVSTAMLAHRLQPLLPAKFELFLEFTRIVTEHLGAGFFVSAISVLAYEWAAHTKSATELADKAIDHSRELLAFMDTKVVKVADAVGREAIFRALAGLPGTYRSFYRHFATLTNAIAELAHAGDWSKTAYLEFIEYFVDQVVKNAAELKAFSTALQQDLESTREFTLNLGTTGALAARILTREILLLRSGGSYDALSDVTSWQYLDEFLEAQKLAVMERGAKIRRIFFLPTEGEENAASVITDHYGFASKWTAASKYNGSYSVRVITEEQFRHIVHTRSPQEHFGIFTSGFEGNAPIAFQVRQGDLSGFSLRGLGLDNSLSRQFEALWSDRDKQKHRDVVDLLLENEVRHFDDRGRYCVVSDFESWFDGGLKRFHGQCIKNVHDKKRKLKVHRIFVTRPGDDLERCAQVLREHFGDLCAPSDSTGEYAVRACTEADAVARFDPAWQCGFFIAPGAVIEDAQLILTEASKPDLSDFVVRPAENDRRAREFNGLWQIARPLDKKSPMAPEEWLAELRRVTPS